jgi:hypothetical protein
MKLQLLLILALLGGCTVAVTHPSKTTAEMKADIDFCTRYADEVYWADAVAAHYEAYDCLEGKGYRREGESASPAGKKGLAEPPKPTTAQPCTVPCARKLG